MNRRNEFLAVAELNPVEGRFDRARALVLLTAPAGEPGQPDADDDTQNDDSNENDEEDPDGDQPLDGGETPGSACGAAGILPLLAMVMSLMFFEALKLRRKSFGR